MWQNTKLSNQSCAVNQRVADNLQWSQYNLNPTGYQMLLTPPSSQVPTIYEQQQISTTGNIHKDFALEANLQRGLVINSGTCVQQALQPNKILYPWQSNNQATQQVQPAISSQLQPQLTRLPGKTSLDDVMNQGLNQAYSDRAFLAAAVFQPRPGEQPNNWLSNRGQDTYLTSMKQLEAQAKQESDKKRAEAAAVRQYYRQNPTFQKAYSTGTPLYPICQVTSSCRT